MEKRKHHRSSIKTIMNSCYCAIANTWAGDFHFCSAAPSLCIHKIKVKGDQRIAWRRYILVVYTKVETLVRMVERPAAFNHCQSVRTEHRYGVFMVSSSHGIHLPFFDNIPTSSRSPVLREYLRGHITEIISVMYYIHYTLLNLLKNERNYCTCQKKKLL